MGNSEMLQIAEATKGKKYYLVRNQIVDLIKAPEIPSEEKAKGILKLLADAIQAEACTLWTLDFLGDGFVHPMAVYGGSEIKDIKLRPGEGIAGQVIQNNKSTIVKDCKKDPKWTVKADNKSGFITRTMICVPVTLDGKTFASIQIINKKGNELFDDKDLELADGIAEVISSTLSNSSKAVLKEMGLYRSNWDEEMTFSDVFAAKTKDEAVAIMEEQPLYEKLSFIEKPLARDYTARLWSMFHRVDKS